ncbi:hypothetical protein SAMN05880501_104216 [Ureibacillus xyleni]|uniref:DUF2922 family protein n=1 Tax=Ureibacillus xyleni TaxID=614648 RepID=A0A285SJT6_9BACL|nr:DUF2922 domain-containing protein [Ureibacillus xyleni]SOC06228.1 hypothetical protein SAMN05880501_104216 [Ureibacillus xyleni]
MKVLELKFDTEIGKIVTISISDPKPNLTPDQIKTAMTAIIDSDVFHKEGYKFTAINQARIVARDVTEFDLMS